MTAERSERKRSRRVDAIAGAISGIPDGSDPVIAEHSDEQAAVRGSWRLSFPHSVLPSSRQHVALEHAGTLRMGWRAYIRFPAIPSHTSRVARCKARVIEQDGERQSTEDDHAPDAG
jgi:hypothetical protein